MCDSKAQGNQALWMNQQGLQSDKKGQLELCRSQPTGKLLDPCVCQGLVRCCNCQSICSVNNLITNQNKHVLPINYHTVTEDRKFIKCLKAMLIKRKPSAPHTHHISQCSFQLFPRFPDCQLSCMLTCISLTTRNVFLLLFWPRNLLTAEWLCSCLNPYLIDGFIVFSPPLPTPPFELSLLCMTRLHLNGNSLVLLFEHECFVRGGRFF